jgi:hypothetical protein
MRQQTMTEWSGAMARPTTNPPCINANIIKQFGIGIVSQFQLDWEFEGNAAWIQDDIVQSPVSIISKNDKGDSTPSM